MYFINIYFYVLYAFLHFELIKISKCSQIFEQRYIVNHRNIRTSNIADFERLKLFYNISIEILITDDKF